LLAPSPSGKSNLRRAHAQNPSDCVVQDQFVEELEEHQKLVIEMRELSPELRDCVEEMRKAISSVAKPKEKWSPTDLL
jgi:hypothetical protein